MCADADETADWRERRLYFNGERRRCDWKLLVGGAIYNNMAEATAMEEDVRRGRNRTETSGGSRDDVGDVQLNSHLSLRDSIRISGTGTGSVHSPRDRTRDAI